VDVIDTLSNSKVKEIAVGLEPTSCTAGLGGFKVYVTNFGDDTISVIDARTDQVVKTIRFAADPASIAIGTLPPTLNPWNSEISRVNGNLYVTYWGTPGNVTPNGGIAEFDTCRDEFLRLVIDDTTRGTPPGSAGASGIDAPTGPLTRDSATGLTPGAGGGGGGSFGIAACGSAFDAAMLFTNDGTGTIGVIDTRIDQVVSAPPIAIVSCPKPRDASCVTVAGKHIAYIACGQPDSSVLVASIPELRENIPDIPFVSGGLFLGTLSISGSGFSPGMRLGLIVDGHCLEFRKEPKIKKGGTLMIQKGRLTDGRSLADALGPASSRFLRVTTPAGDVRLGSCCAIP
jgi:YVTN family beta-propeller protein